MKWVLDSNIGVKWELREDQSDKARAVRDEYSKGLHELLAPDTFTKVLLNLRGTFPFIVDLASLP